jgi:hypothetical protein
MKNEFFKTFDDVNAGFDKIGQRAIDLRKKQLQDISDSNKPPKPKKEKKQSDHGLADALAELDAQIKGQNALAAAYQVSDAAAIKAEAHQKAEEEAIRHKGQVGIFYEKELALAVAKRAAEGAKTIADLRYEADSRAAVNSQVAAGLIPASRASAALELESKLRPLTAAAAVAEGEAKQRLVDIIRALTKANGDNNDQIERAQVLSATSAGKDQLEQLRLEATLIGATNKERAVAIAQLAAEQYLRDHPGASAEEASAYVQTMKDIASGTADLQTAQDNYNSSLSYMHDLLQGIGEQADALGGILSNAFGGFGDSVGSAISSLSGYFEKEQEALRAQGPLQGALDRLQGDDRDREGLCHLPGGADGDLDCPRHCSKTISHLTNSATRTAANTAEGGSKIFAELGPWAFPVVAAMVALLAPWAARAAAAVAGRPSPTSMTFRRRRARDCPRRFQGQEREHRQQPRDRRGQHQQGSGIHQRHAAHSAQHRCGHFQARRHDRPGNPGRQFVRHVGPQARHQRHQGLPRHRRQERRRTLADKGIIISGSPLQASPRTTRTRRCGTRQWRRSRVLRLRPSSRTGSTAPATPAPTKAGHRAASSASAAALRLASITTLARYRTRSPACSCRSSARCATASSPRPRWSALTGLRPSSTPSRSRSGRSASRA